MAEKQWFREYRFKFYLNMNHYIIINGTEGALHPHTWEFTFRVVKEKDDFMQFDTFERLIEEYLNKYQGTVLNEVEPFNVIVPTLENVADHFSEQIRKIIRDNGSELVSVESSETPTRSYIINYEREPDFLKRLDNITENKMDEIIDIVLDGVLEE